MDYLYFVFCVAVLATIVGLCWRQFVIKSNSSKFGAAGTPFPPMKTTLDGIAEVEIKRIELQDRIDVWQRSRARRIEQLQTKEEPPVSGEKYVFTPPRESRARTLRRSSSVAPLRQRFELIR